MQVAARRVRIPTRGTDTPYEMQARDGNLWLSPSDVTTFLGCEHATTLSVRAARGELEVPAVPNDEAQLIFRKGLEHEAAYLASLRSQGKTVADLSREHLDWERGRQETIDAMRTGVDVVYQAALVDERLARHRRLPRALGDDRRRSGAGATRRSTPSSPAAPSRPTSCSSASTTSRSAASRGGQPEQIHVLLGSGETASFRPQEFGAYYRRVRSRLVEFVDAGPRHGAVPERPLRDLRVQAALRRVVGRGRPPLPGRGPAAAADRAARAPPGSRLSPVSGARRPSPRPRGCRRRRSRRSASRRRSSSGRASTAATGSSSSRRRRTRGSRCCRSPRAGDLFFDFEGNPFWDRDGSLEYLWGILDTDRSFTPLWAYDHETERAAFEQFIDLVHERLARDPNLHVYHYAAYEITALKRLMGRYGTREAELDDLLRRGVFVDLYKVVRNGLRASRPGYGLKELEAFLDFHRRGGGEGRRQLDRHVRGVDADARAGAARQDRRLQRGGLHRDAAAARLAARAARRGAARVRALPAAGAGRAEAGAGGQGRARRAARGAPRRGRGARRAPARLPRARAQAGLVGLLRPAREDARRAASTTRSRSAGSPSPAAPSR